MAVVFSSMPLSIDKRHRPISIVLLVPEHACFEGSKKGFPKNTSSLDRFLSKKSSSTAQHFGMDVCSHSLHDHVPQHHKLL